MSRAKNWCFTAFNFEHLLDPERWEHFRYCVYQEELCPKTNRPQVQGFVQFTRQRSMRQAKKLLGL